MRIAVIGAGSVGAALGRNWVKAGHEVRYGVRKPDDSKYVALGQDRLATPKDAAGWAEIVVVATPWHVTEAAIAGLGNLAGKIVIDCTNPLAMGPDGLGLAIGHSVSGGEKVAGWAQGAAVFKAFNTTGASNMADSSAYKVKPVMFVAGDDAAHKPVVLELVETLGFEAVDAGPLPSSRLLEAYAMLWIDLAMKRGQGRDFAFALIRKPA